MRDYDIVYPWIQLRQEDGSLTTPKRTTTVLKKLNMESQTLILLASPRTDNSSKGPQYPICRIADRKVEQEKEDATKKKGPKLVSKELELNWAIAPHDLQIRMAQLKKFLSKGYQVQVRMLTPKKRNKRKASLDEAKEVLRIVKEAVAEVPGAKETKGMEGTVGDVVILHLHAPSGGTEAVEEASTVTETEKPAVIEA
jgi:translation initiation factor IF-3